MNTRVRLQEYKNEFGKWNDTRINELYERLQNGEVLNFKTVSTKYGNLCDKQVRMIKNKLNQIQYISKEKSKVVNTYVLIHNGDIETGMVVSDYLSEYKCFNEWFNKILKRDIQDMGLNFKRGRKSCFTIEDVELDKVEGYSLNEFKTLLMFTKLDFSIKI